MTKTLPQKVVSRDGTEIAVEETGSGRPVVLVGGAFNDRTTTTGLSRVLSPYFRAVTYDRRGRGDSGDVSRDFSVDREVEDLEAIIHPLGGSASVFGHSSGAVLALEAAARRLPVDRVVAYEPPYIAEGSRPRPGADVGERLQALVKADDRDGAVLLYQTEVIGLPAPMVDGMRASEMWAFLTALAHTLPYDFALFEPGCPVPTGRLSRIEVPVLVMAGSNTFPWVDAAARQVAQAVPRARYHVLDGQDHGVLHQPDALVPSLREFLGSATPSGDSDTPRG